MQPNQNPFHQQLQATSNIGQNSNILTHTNELTTNNNNQMSSTGMKKQQIIHDQEQILLKQSQQKGAAQDNAQDQQNNEQVVKSNIGSQNNKKLYYKYCCNSCIHLENSNKSCVCIVPRSKRKKTIGQQGCQTCKCRGCTAQDDLIRNEEDKKRKNSSSTKKADWERERERGDRNAQQRSRSRDKEGFNPQNGCCKKCIRALSKNRKACLCQVPKKVRKSKLPPEGCKLCGCHGCHPRDSENYEYSSEQKYSDYSVSNSEDEEKQNFNYIENSIIGKIVASEYDLYPPLLGLGIPQRTPSYILGRPL